MKKLVFICILVFFALSKLLGQYPVKSQGIIKNNIVGKIEGRVIDSTSNLPVSFATISLVNSKNKKLINGTISEENGEFVVNGLEMGKYELIVSFVGYYDRNITNVELTNRYPDKSLGDIKLFSSNFILKEVSVKAQKPIYENKVDRLIYSPQNDASIIGGDAIDVLRKTPLLSVDQDGNVSLRGSNNVKILINGKPSGMFSSNANEALKMFPANEITKVEVITSPGAKYDGEGAGGIINIITKKNDIEGIAGDITTGFGNRMKNMRLNLSVGKGRFGSNVNAGFMYRNPTKGATEFYRETIDPIIGNSAVSTIGFSTTDRLGLRGTASAFYDINGFQSINSSISVYGHSRKSNSSNKSTLTGFVGELIENYDTDRINDDKKLGFDWNIDWTIKFPKNEKQQLVFAYQLIKDKEDSDVELDQTNRSLLPAISESLLQVNDGTNYQHTFQSDLTLPFLANNTIDLGFKAILRNLNSFYQTDTLYESIFHKVENLSNEFDYKQNILSSYAEVGFKIGQIQAKVGVRLENTNIDGNFEYNLLPFTNSYFNILPSFAVSKALKGYSNLRLAYSQRIQRPSLSHINPFAGIGSRTSLKFGNPYLNPEILHQVELSMNAKLLGLNFFLSPYIKYTKSTIEEILNISSEGVSISTYQNIGTNKSTGLNIFTTSSIKNLSIRFNADLFTYNATGIINGKKAENTDFQYQLFGNADYTILKNIKLSAFIMYRAKSVTLQGVLPSFYMISIGMAKDWNKWSLGVRVSSPFSDYINLRTDQTVIGNKGAITNQKSNYQLPIRSFSLELKYKFGSVNFKQRNSKIQNQDQKSNDNGQNTQM